MSVLLVLLGQARHSAQDVSADGPVLVTETDDDQSRAVANVQSARTQVVDAAPAASTTPAALPSVSGFLKFADGSPVADAPFRIELSDGRVVSSSRLSADGAWTAPSGWAAEQDAVLQVDLGDCCGLRVHGLPAAHDRTLTVPNLEEFTVRWLGSGSLNDDPPVIYVDFLDEDGRPAVTAPLACSAFGVTMSLTLPRGIQVMAGEQQRLVVPPALYRVACRTRSATSSPPSYDGVCPPCTMTFTNTHGDTHWIEIIENGQLVVANGRAVLERPGRGSNSVIVEQGRGPLFRSASDEDRLHIAMADGRLVDIRVGAIDKSNGNWRISLDGASRPVCIPLGEQPPPHVVAGIDAQQRHHFLSGDGSLADEGLPFFACEAGDVRVHRPPPQWRSFLLLWSNGRVGWAQPGPTGKWHLRWDEAQQPLLLDWERVTNLVADPRNESVALHYELDMGKPEVVQWIPIDVLRLRGPDLHTTGAWLKLRPGPLRARIIARYALGGQSRTVVLAD
jgi:hypothetical protein